MSPRFTRLINPCALVLIAALAAFAALPRPALAWGGTGQRRVVNQAISTGPGDLRAYLESNRSFLVQHVTDPLDAEATNPAERHNHFIRLDKYGRFPFDALPRSYKGAVNKYGKSKIESTGLLPWAIGVYSQKLTQAMKLGPWDETKLDAAILAFYVGGAHDPFTTTHKFRGPQANQH